MVDDLVAALYLVTGRIAPAYEPGGELNIGGSTVRSGGSFVHLPLWVLLWVVVHAPGLEPVGS